LKQWPQRLKGGIRDCVQTRERRIVEW